jgi:hypothetical protein
MTVNKIAAKNRQAKRSADGRVLTQLGMIFPAL